MSETPLLLIDTCVWIDAYLGERKGHDIARSLIDTALDMGAELLYAITTCKDVYYLIGVLLKKRASESEGSLSAADTEAIKRISQGCLTSMRAIATAVALDESDVWIAEKLQGIHSDFEDNLVIAAALRSKADFLVTTDERLIAHSPVAALTPQDAITYLKEGIAS